MQIDLIIRQLGHSVVSAHVKKLPTLLVLTYFDLIKPNKWNFNNIMLNMICCLYVYVLVCVGVCVCLSLCLSACLSV